MGSVLLPITLVTAAGCAIINLWLSMRIGKTRGAEKVSIGDGGSEPLIRRMRAQANFVENAPFVVILIGLIELAKGPGTALWVVASTFLICRVLHALGMDGMKYGRMIGTAITMLILLGLAVYAIVLVYTGQSLTPVQVTNVA